MPRTTILNHALALGFEDIERALEQVTKLHGDGYPPYNIERDIQSEDTADEDELLRIVVAVAGFSEDLLDVTLEGRQLTITGNKPGGNVAGATAQQGTKDYLHQGIATRQFQRSFILADCIEVGKASLNKGLLSIELIRTRPEARVRKIKIICD